MNPLLTFEPDANAPAHDEANASYCREPFPHCPIVVHESCQFASPKSTVGFAGIPFQQIDLKTKRVKFLL
jgi:hypothetical protein